jgi:GNAT superfamily N-acetyltransferase
MEMTTDPEPLVPSTVELAGARRVLLRPARPEDAADLVEIERQVIEENVANVDDRGHSTEEMRDRIAASDPAGLWLVGESAGRVAGSLRLLPPGPSFLRHIRNLYIDVDREWRGRGLGAALIRAGVSWARTHGVELLALSVLDSNPRALTLYQRLGFEVTGHTPRLVKRPDGSCSDDTQMVLVV